MLDYISPRTLILECQKKKKKKSTDSPSENNMKMIVLSNVYK